MPTQNLVVRMTLLQNVSKELARLGKDFFHFHDRVARSHRILNNVFFATFRKLARIRTGIFLILTALAVRPIINFFQRIIDDSATASFAMARLNEKWFIFRQTVAEKLLPIFVKVRETIYEMQLRLLEFASRHPEFFRGVILAAGTFLGIIEAIGKSIVVMAENFKDSLRVMRDGALAIAIAITQTFVNVFKELFKPGRTFEKITDFVPQDSNWALDLVWKAFGVSAGRPKFKAIAEQIVEPGGMLYEALATVPWGKSFADAMWTGFTRTENFLDVTMRDMIARLSELTEKGPLKEVRDFWTVKSITGPAVALADVSAKTLVAAQTELARLLERARKGESLFESKGREAAFHFVAGFREGLMRENKVLLVAVEDMAKDIRQNMEGMVSDTLVAAMEGKLSRIRDIFISFLRSIQKAIADFIAQRLVQETIVTALSFVLGAIGKRVVVGDTAAGTPTTASGHTPVPGGQHGGIVTRPRIMRLGEAGPEAIIPLNRAAPGLKGKMGIGSTVNVTFAPQVIDGPSFAAWLVREKQTIKRLMVAAATGEDLSVRKAFKVSGR